ncbi:hypothetical protein KIPB_015251, partial [Kipferlia bialata]|eukprot:g15251.t1
MRAQVCCILLACTVCVLGAFPPAGMADPSDLGIIIAMSVEGFNKLAE